jgi:hypothetical protein
MPLQATSGAASYDAFGGGVPAVPLYIEDVFQIWLDSGADNDVVMTIAPNIDFTKGGILWRKSRGGAYSNRIFDTQTSSYNSAGYFGRNHLITNSSSGKVDGGVSNAAEFTNAGWVHTSEAGDGFTNTSTSFGSPYVSWGIRKQSKFFDVVSYTGTGSNTTIAHSLGSVPACIMVKRTDASGDWRVYHRSLANTEYLTLNTTAMKATGATIWNSTTPTSTVFSIGTDATVNASAGKYVAYLFAHDAGGFGLTGTDNVISCGSFTSDGSGLATVNLGYEPQWVLWKKTDSTASWYLFDTMRGMTMVNDAWVFPDISDAEGSGIDLINPTATGFTVDVSPFGWQDSNLIYIAIRKGPMKVPSTGTSVFGLSARTGTGANATVTGGQTDDTVLIKNRGAAQGTLFASRLTATRYLLSSSDAAQATAGTTILQANPWDVMDGVKVGTTSAITNASSNTFINYLFKRAPSFHDVVCYTGDGTNGRSITHNLTVAPELIIVKERSNIDDWAVYSATYGRDYYAFLNFNYDFLSFNTADFWGTSGPTTTAFGVSNNSSINQSARTYIAYLFATCAGVSKVGSYTGTATTKQIDCGFTAGARFVMIKRGDSTGDWYVWDTARGIVAGNDQYFLLNTTAAEVTNTDYIDTYSAGFEISSTAPAAINANGGTYIFLAIA